MGTSDEVMPGANRVSFFKNYIPLLKQRKATREEQLVRAKQEKVVRDGEPSVRLLCKSRERKALSLENKLGSCLWLLLNPMRFNSSSVSMYLVLLQCIMHRSEFSHSSRYFISTHTYIKGIFSVRVTRKM
jgi:type IV secretory pathway protease TraF